MNAHGYTKISFKHTARAMSTKFPHSCHPVYWTSLETMLIPSLGWECILVNELDGGNGGVGE